MRVKQQEEEAKQKEREAAMRGREQLERMRSYSQEVLQKHKPKTEPKKEEPKEDKTMRHSLTGMEQRAKGLQYLTQAKLTAKHNKSKDNKDKQPDNDKNNAPKRETSLPMLKQTAYKDYLREMPSRIPQSAQSL